MALPVARVPWLLKKRASALCLSLSVASQKKRFPSLRHQLKSFITSPCIHLSGNSLLLLAAYSMGKRTALPVAGIPWSRLALLYSPSYDEKKKKGISSLPLSLSVTSQKKKKKDFPLYPSLRYQLKSFITSPCIHLSRDFRHYSIIWCH